MCIAGCWEAWRRTKPAYIYIYIYIHTHTYKNRERGMLGRWETEHMCIYIYMYIHMCIYIYVCMYMTGQYKLYAYSYAVR